MGDRTVDQTQVLKWKNKAICQGFRVLNGLHHEDFAVLLTALVSDFTHTKNKCSCKTMRKTSYEFYQGELTISFFFQLVIFEDLHCSIKLFFQVSIHFIHFYPFHLQTPCSFLKGH